MGLGTFEPPKLRRSIFGNAMFDVHEIEALSCSANCVSLRHNRERSCMQRGSDFPTYIYSQACTASSGYAAVRMAYLTLMERQSSEANKLSKYNTQTHFTNAYMYSCKSVVKYYPASTAISVKHYPASAAISVDRGGTQQYWQPRLRSMISRLSGLVSCSRRM